MFKKKKELINKTGEQIKNNKIRSAEFDFEVTLEEIRRKSNAKAWNFTRISMGLNALLVIAIVMMMPLKTVDTYVVEINKENYEAKVLSVADDTSIPFNELRDKYWLNQYVMARESYQFDQLKNDYAKTRELSMPVTFSDYNANYNTLQGLQYKLGNKRRIDIHVVSISTDGSGSGTVRFRRDEVEVKSGDVLSSAMWVAEIVYEYHPEIKMTEERRLINPAGFKVVNYRASREMVN